MAVVELDRITGGDTGHHCLGAAGVACEIMVFHIADADASVGCHDSAVIIRGCAALCRAKMNGIIRIGIKTSDAGINLFACQVFHFLYRAWTVRAKGEVNGDILIAHTAIIELSDQSGKDFPARAGSCDIACDNRDGFARFHDFAKSRGRHRIFQRFLDKRLLIAAFRQV